MSVSRGRKLTLDLIPDKINFRIRGTMDIKEDKEKEIKNLETGAKKNWGIHCCVENCGCIVNKGNQETVTMSLSQWKNIVATIEKLKFFLTSIKEAEIDYWMIDSIEMSESITVTLRLAKYLHKKLEKINNYD